MKIIDILKASTKPFPSLEIVPPPSGMKKDELFSTVESLMAFKPKYINVTCHRDEVTFTKEQDGSYSRHIVRNKISELAVCAAITSQFGIEVVPHIICGGSSKDYINSLLYDFRFLGISNVMALRGDSLVGEKRFTAEPDGYAHANELVEGIRRFEKDNQDGNGFCIGVGAYPEKHFEAPNIETDIENLKRKIDAGADYIITQMFFDNADFYRFRDACDKAGIQVPIIPGLKPISTIRHIKLLPESFSINIPLSLSRAIEDAAHDKESTYRIGTSWCIDQCTDLIANGVPAVHFYTMGKARNIVDVLKACFDSEK